MVLRWLWPVTFWDLAGFLSASTTSATGGIIQNLDQLQLKKKWNYPHLVNEDHDRR